MKYEYNKGNYYIKVNKESRIIVIGDDYENDILPAETVDCLTYLVDFNFEEANIYSVITEIIRTLMVSSIPSTMRIETYTRCNEKCCFCPYPSLTRKQGRMNIELFGRLVQEHSQIVTNPKILFPASIGEPFLDIDFFSFVAIASKYYKSISTFSNGSVLRAEVVSKYIDSGGTELLLTLHGFNERDYTNITGTDYYHIVRDNIINAARLNSRTGNQLNIILDIYMYGTPSKADKFVEELRNLNVFVNICDIQHTHNWGGKVNDADRKLRVRGCPRIYSQFGVQFDGAVVPCCVDTEGEYKLGNANTQSLSDIFSGQAYLSLVGLEKSELLTEIQMCKYCNIV
jgi:radical SAM protein with 4Fe4S-binding SPASM domain